MSNVIHIGKRSRWDGKVKTLCGLVYASNNQKQAGWLSSVSCPACLAAEKVGKKL
jgi:hypothetical protein